MPGSSLFADRACRSIGLPGVHVTRVLGEASQVPPALMITDVAFDGALTVNEPPG